MIKRKICDGVVAGDPEDDSKTGRWVLSARPSQPSSRLIRRRWSYRDQNSGVISNSLRQRGLRLAGAIKDEAKEAVAEAIPLLEGKARQGYPGTIRDILAEEHPEDYEVDLDGEAYGRFDYAKGSLDEYRYERRTRRGRRMCKSVGVTSGMSTRTAPTGTAGTSGRSTRPHSRGISRAVSYTDTREGRPGSLTHAIQDDSHRGDREVRVETRHIIRLDDGTVRRLLPLERERLNQFPDDWTDFGGIKDSKRGFLMGNALVTGVVHRLSARGSDEKGRQTS